MSLLKNKETFKPSQFEAPADYAGPRFEYRARNLAKVPGIALEKDFNDHGTQGWEFVAMATGGKEGYAIFKRRVGS